MKSRITSRLAKSWFFSIAGRGAGFVLFLFSVQILTERAFTRFSILYAAMGFIAFVLFTFEQNYRFGRADGEAAAWMIWPGALGTVISVAIVTFATRSPAIALAMAAIALLQSVITRRRVELLFGGEQMALYLSPLVRDGTAILGFLLIPASRQIEGIAVLMVVAVVAELIVLSLVVQRFVPAESTNAAPPGEGESSAAGKRTQKQAADAAMAAGVLTMVASLMLAVTPLVIRSLVLRLLGDANFAVFEIADRYAYVLMSVVVGGMSVEALRRWRLAVTDGQEQRVVRESIVAVLLIVVLIVAYSLVILSPFGEWVLTLLLGPDVDVERIQRITPIIAVSSAAYVSAHLVSRALVALHREPTASALLAGGAAVTMLVAFFATWSLDSLNLASAASAIGFGIAIAASLAIAVRIRSTPAPQPNQSG